MVVTCGAGGQRLPVGLLCGCRTGGLSQARNPGGPGRGCPRRAVRRRATVESAQAHLLSLIEFDGGELQQVYEDLADEYEASRDAAEEVSERIDAIEDVADALFDEWEDELDQYSNDRLRRRQRAQAQRYP